MTHCWADYQGQFKYMSEAYLDAMDRPSATCMLMDGHDGPHEWTPDDEIRIVVTEAP